MRFKNFCSVWTLKNPPFFFHYHKPAFLPLVFISQHLVFFASHDHWWLGIQINQHLRSNVPQASFHKPIEWMNFVHSSPHTQEGFQRNTVKMRRLSRFVLYTWCRLQPGQFISAGRKDMTTCSKYLEGCVTQGGVLGAEGWNSGRDKKEGGLGRWTAWRAFYTDKGFAIG